MRKDIFWLTVAGYCPLSQEIPAKELEIADHISSTIMKLRIVLASAQLVSFSYSPVHKPRNAAALPNQDSPSKTFGEANLV